MDTLSCVGGGGEAVNSIVITPGDHKPRGVFYDMYVLRLCTLSIPVILIQDLVLHRIP